MLVFLGCLVAVVSNGNFILMTLSFGIVVMSMIMVFGNQHDVHLNPAVTFTIFINKGIDLIRFLMYYHN